MDMSLAAMVETQTRACQDAYTKGMEQAATYAHQAAECGMTPQQIAHGLDQIVSQLRFVAITPANKVPG